MNRSYKRPDDSPSFSSSLLEKVFRSIDEGADEPVYSTAARKGSISLNGLEIHRSSIEKKKKNKVGTNRRNFETEIAAANKSERPNGTALRTDCNDSGFKISISRSYEDSELRAQTPSVIPGVRNLKPIRTTSTAASRPDEKLLTTQSSCVSSRKVHRREGSSMPKPAEAPSSSFQNAKCRAAKMYGDLKNTKQPISPGGKLTRFITSLFSKRNSTNKQSSEKVIVRENEAVTTCSSASSYYRSCLRNRPTANSSSSSKSSTCPVNVVIDDRQQQQQRRLVTTIKSLSHKSGENCQVQRELLEKYNNTTNGVLNNIHDKLEEEDEDYDDDDDDDDDGSCASSDLFELEHIGGNGNGTLPVYGSTQQFHSNNPPLLL
ncbi:hypothetical protein QQ045_025184 [Rhodiola kirilowii]